MANMTSSPSDGFSQAYAVQLYFGIPIGYDTFGTVTVFGFVLIMLRHLWGNSYIISLWVD